MEKYNGTVPSHTITHHLSVLIYFLIKNGFLGWNREIKDPEQSKPEDWVDEKKIPDPEDTKPEGYDDIPKDIPDPDATKPDDWDDDEDGEWEPTLIRNPEYKGPWKPKMISNPDYKGKGAVCCCCCCCVPVAGADGVCFAPDVGRISLSYK